MSQTPLLDALQEGMADDIEETAGNDRSLLDESLEALCQQEEAKRNAVKSIAMWRAVALFAVVVVIILLTAIVWGAIALH